MADQSSDLRQKGYCPLCISRCGLVSVVRDGRLIAVEADPSHPTGAALCLKGRSAPEQVYAPERVLTPLRRTRPKAHSLAEQGRAVFDESGWEPISWQDALAEIAAKLTELAAKDGPESVVFAVGTPSGTALSDSFVWIHRLAHAFGSPNILFATENCNWHRDFGSALTFGTGLGMPDFRQTGCVVIWGANPAATWPAMAAEILAAQQRGARLVVIDPRQTGLGMRAGQWLGLRPGSDGILALAMIGVALRDSLFDLDFTRRWTNACLLVRDCDGEFLTAAHVQPDGQSQTYLVWDEARGMVCSHDPDAADCHWAITGAVTIPTKSGPIVCRPVLDLLRACCDDWPMEQVETVTGISAAQIQQTVRLMHSARPVSWYSWTGTGQHAEATQITRAMGILFALMGDWDADGGNRHFGKPPLRDVSGYDLLSESQRQKTLGLADRPLGPAARGWVAHGDVIKAIVQHSPYPVRALVSFGGNPGLTRPHQDGQDQALADLDFYVHADMVINPAAQFADIILPVASPWERDGIMAGFQITAPAQAMVQLRPETVAPRGQSRSDMAIVFALADALGLSGFFCDGDMERALDWALAPCGVTVSDLRAHPSGLHVAAATTAKAYEKQGFATQSRLIELYSHSLHQIGQPALPAFTLPPDDPDFPLRLTTAKWPFFCHSQHRSLPSVQRRMPDPLVEISPQDAQSRQIQAGDWVHIHTRHGHVAAKARITPAVSPGFVCAQYGWWPENLNAILDGSVQDPVSGANALKSSWCQIRLR